jgi:hypothetical protein
MQHFKSRWIILLILTVTLISWKWQVLVLLVGAEICSQSLHEKIHHPTQRLAHWSFRLIGILIAIIGAWYLR